jgi:3-oxoacyl-[acyl-carrier protein] reductase
VTGRVAVVTGAAGGLGQIISTTLLGRGYRVVLADLDAEAAAKTAAALDPMGTSSFEVRLDVRRKEDFEFALVTTLERWGRVDVLVNNAGVSKAEPLMEITPESFREVMDSNLLGAFFGSQVFGAHFAARGGGRIVNVASLAGQNGGTSTGAHYAAAKGGVATLTKVFARELAASGVTVNAVSPGPLDLPVVRRLVPADRLAAVVAGIPTGSLGSPDFVAEVVALLAGESAAGVTGACWDVNGGLYMR